MAANGRAGGKTDVEAGLVNGLAQKKAKLALFKQHSVALVLDFGSQYTQLIGRRVRELGVYSMLKPADCTLEDIKEADPKVIILSGGPESIYLDGSPTLPAGLLEHVAAHSIPMLGICYGMQLLVHSLGGTVKAGNSEYGRMAITAEDGSMLYSYAGAAGHREEQGAIVGVENAKRRLFGLQYHPEVEHTLRGPDLLRHFLFDIAAVPADWRMENVLEEEMAKIAQLVGLEEHVICALSGGVDSTVAATLVHKVLGDRLHCVFVDNGLLRYKEAERVMKTFNDHLHLPVTMVDDSVRMVTGVWQPRGQEAGGGDWEVGRFGEEGRWLQRPALWGVTGPEAKRKIIGKGFIDVFQEFANNLQKSHGIKPRFLVQGTLYPDVIESCPPPGAAKGKGKSHTIKSHHNVGGLPEDLQFQLIEPLRELFKDEVRALGRLPAMGVPESFVARHPFPGPGLGVRIIGDITQDDHLDVLRQADEIYISYLREAGLYDNIWQAFAVFPKVKTVGVQGDKRTDHWQVALRAVVSKDGMTAQMYEFEMKDLAEISSRICNQCPKVSRVAYDITSKPPGTIEWE